MASTSLAIPPALTRAYQRHGRLLPRIAEVVLVILIAQALAQLMWKLIPAPPAAPWRPASSFAGPSVSAAKQDAGIDKIVAAHLFGQYQPQKPAAPEDIEEAPDTRLNLTLFGILAATVERGSRALISAPNTVDKPYAVGDDVVKGVRLQAIFPDRVILARAGQLETLRMKKNERVQASASSHRVASSKPRSGALELSADTAALLGQIRQKLLADPGQAATYIRVQPASRGGQLRGYRLYPGRDRAAFTAVGLRPGDLVTQVNGIQLNNANTALQMLGQLSEAQNLSVVVERGGKEQTMNVNFN